MNVVDIIAALPADMALDQVALWLDTPNEILDGVTPTSALAAGQDVDVRFAASRVKIS